MSQPGPFTLTCLDWHVFWVRFQHTINANTGHHETEPAEVIRWCMANLQGKWSWGSKQAVATSRPFYIQDGQDAMMFKLVWGGR